MVLPTATAAKQCEKSLHTQFMQAYSSLEQRLFTDSIADSTSQHCCSDEETKNALKGERTYKYLYTPCSKKVTR